MVLSILAACFSSLQFSFGLTEALTDCRSPYVSRFNFILFFKLNCLSGLKRICISWIIIFKFEQLLWKELHIQYNNAYIDKKVADIRDGTASISIPEFTVNNLANRNQFEMADVIYITTVINESPTEHCVLNHFPTWLMKGCISILAAYVTDISNQSITTGC